MKTLKEKIEVMRAAQDGKQIEIMRCNKPQWDKIQQPLFNWEDNDYRVKPEPKLVPLEMADIPPMCWIYNPAESYAQSLVIGKTRTALRWFQTGPREMIYIELMVRGYQYSSDGVNFKPCSKMQEYVEADGSKWNK